MMIRNFTEEQQRWIIDALNLLREADAGAYQHVVTALVAVEPGYCGPGALACTAGSLGRVARLSFDLARASLEDIAVAISHEARHHRFTLFGWEVVAHTCGDCTNLQRQGGRGRDPIYLEDARLWARMRQVRVARVGEAVASAALIVGAGFLVAKALPAGAA